MAYLPPLNDECNHFEKPPLVKFKFCQGKRFYNSGEVQDQHGRVVYSFIDRGDQHMFGFMKSHPLEIYRQPENTLVATIYWNKSPQTATVKGLAPGGPMNIQGGLMNKHLVWRLPDGSKFEWDGIWGRDFQLFDYRIPQRFSLVPAVVALHKPRSVTGKATTNLQVLREAIRVPDFLDHLIVTSLWLEYVTYDMENKDKMEKLKTKFISAATKKISGK